MQILDSDPKGQLGGTLYQFDDGTQMRLVDILKLETPDEKYKGIIANVLTYAEAVRKDMRHKR